MTEGDKARLIAWNHEMRTVHERLRAALRLTRIALAGGASTEPAQRDLLLFCHGFCTALTGHHEGEDRELFPAVAAGHPELRDVLRNLQQDHSMIAYLLGAFQAAVDRTAPADELDRHLEGVEAIMESHFRYEERSLGVVLEALELDADPGQILGPL